MPTLPVSTKADGSGNAIAQFMPIPTGRRIRVSQVSVQALSASVSSALLVLDKSLVVAASANGNQDTADGEPPVDLTSHNLLQVLWQNCDPGAACVAVFFYDDIKAAS